MPFKLPRLQARLPIVDKEGNPMPSFLRFFNIDFVGRIEQQEASQAAVLVSLQNIQSQQSAQLALINQALELAGLALETADSGGTTKSGSETSSFALASTLFSAGPLLNLTSVLAGTLTIPGTSPQVVLGTTAMTAGTVTNGEYRLVEVVSGVDTVLFTGTFTVTDVTTEGPVQEFEMNHVSAPDVAALSLSRSTTGAVSYRIDTRRVSGATMTGLRFYLFARRAP